MMRQARDVLTAALALAAACAGPERPVADPENDFRAQIGREWALVRLGAYEIPPPPPGTPADPPGRLILVAEDGTRLTFVPAVAGR